MNKILSKLRPFLSTLLVAGIISSAIACSDSKKDEPTPVNPPQPQPKPDYPELNLPDDDVIKAKAARMLMVGFQGSEIKDGNPVIKYIQEVGVGGIILFDVDLTVGGGIGSRNIKSPQQLKELTAKLKSLASYPLLISADQEGGLVQRLKPDYGFEALPTALDAGNGGASAVDAAGALCAAQLADAGINMNLAPEADLHRDNCPVIGKLKRAYSSDPNKVAEYDAIVIDRHHERNVLTTLKHFPGHGSAVNDSHLGFTDVTQTWSEDELIPFKKLIDNGKADAIMTAHIVNKNLDPDYPASLSKKITTDLLRNKLGFDGLIITDDLYMKAIMDNYKVEDFITLAINAGADMLIVGNNLAGGFESDRPRILVSYILEAVKWGKIPYQRLVEANEHIDKVLEKINNNSDQ